MKNNKEKKYKRNFKKELIIQIRKDKKAFAVYIVLRISVIISMVIALIRGNYSNAGLCFATLIMFLVPSFIERTFKLELPTVLEVVIMCFIYAHAILGEIGCFYVTVPGWDTMLHTINGFICAGVGLSLIDILNRNKKFKFEMSPLYVAIAAFCFSMTIGVLWEFFEFGMDMFAGTDMQKDTVVNSITSVMLDPTRSNTPVSVEGINSVMVNGKELGLGGYLDIGLIDTMKDLFVNFIGAVVFSFGGFFYIKHRGNKRTKFVEGFIPVPAEENKDKK